MKLFRYGPLGEERPGLLDADGLPRDIGAILPDLTSRHLAAGCLEAMKGMSRRIVSGLPLIEGSFRYGSCVASPGTVWAVGKNYELHAREMGGEAPEEPLLFSKAVSSLSGPFDPLLLPEGADCLDYEAELAVVMGRFARRVSAFEATDYIAGYCTANDFSERAWQKERGGQWIKGKSGPGFCPLGPYLVTKDALPSPYLPRLTARVNGELRQEADASAMIHSVPSLIAYISYFADLLPGDVILTGTPAGVGAGMNPPCYLRPKDVVEVEVEGLGAQRTEIC